MAATSFRVSLRRPVAREKWVGGSLVPRLSTFCPSRLQEVVGER